MTVSVQGRHIGVPSITAYEHTQDGTAGFLLHISHASGHAYVFLSEQEGDRLGRYLLYTEPNALEVPSEIAKTLGIDGEDG